MITFVTDDQPEQKPVKITMGVDPVGDLCVIANGMLVLWLKTNGTMRRCVVNKPELEAMGFQTDADGRIALEEP